MIPIYRKDSIPSLSPPLEMDLEVNLQKMELLCSLLLPMRVIDSEGKGEIRNVTGPFGSGHSYQIQSKNRNNGELSHGCLVSIPGISNLQFFYYTSPTLPILSLCPCKGYSRITRTTKRESSLINTLILLTNHKETNHECRYR